MSRFFPLATYLRRRFGARTQKIPLDAGFTCPNRDGSLSRRGCVFCNPSGSGSGLGAKGLAIREQWDFWLERLRGRYKARLFLAYLQSFSNTYGPVSRLASVLDELRGLEGLAGLCLGTRPDCLDADKLDLLASQPLSEVWLDLGLQSSSDATLARINRGHDAASFARAAREADARGLKVCAHVMAGLPGEAEDELPATIDFLNKLPIRGVKFHNLFVCRGTPLAVDWSREAYVPLERERYLSLLERSLARLRPDVVVHRLFADPAPGELLAPAWAADKRGLLAELAERLERRDVWQGKKSGAPDVPPAWFETGSPPWLDSRPADPDGRSAPASPDGPGGPRTPQPLR